MCICLFHACMIGNTLLNRKSCVPFTRAFSVIRKYYCFRVSTLFTLEIGRHVCMVREALASNFGCGCFVLQVRSGRSATYSCPHISVFLA